MAVAAPPLRGTSAASGPDDDRPRAEPSLGRFRSRTSDGRNTTTRFYGLLLATVTIIVLRVDLTAAISKNIGMTILIIRYFFFVKKQKKIKNKKKTEINR